MTANEVEDTGSSDVSDVQTTCGVDPEVGAAAVAEDVQLLSTLANETRYEALRVVASAEEELCACEVEASLAVSQSTVSQALSRLHDAGLVDRRKEGRWRYYEATQKAATLLTTLDAIREADE